MKLSKQLRYAGIVVLLIALLMISLDEIARFAGAPNPRPIWFVFVLIAVTAGGLWIALHEDDD
jgi:MFS-type transporter involved in bile tolerance (Atg22 family)